MKLQMPSRYSSMAIGLHWTIATLIIVNLVLGITHDSFAKASVPTVMGIHKSIGFSVLALSVFRLGWRAGHPAPPPPAAMPGWQVLLARATHILFYVAMIALPLTGWLMSSASPLRFPLQYFWLFNLPFLPVEQSKAAAGFWSETHEILGFSAIGLLVLHVLGALKHHYFDKDDVLSRMLPGR